MKRLGLFTTLGLFMLTLMWPTAAFAAVPTQQIESGQTIDGDLTLYENSDIEEGATVNGDVVVFGGDLNMEGTINGDVAVFGGDIEIKGTVNGDLVIFGGDVSISDSGFLSGDCALFGGKFVDQHDEKTINCSLTLDSPMLNSFVRDFDYSQLADSITDGPPDELLPYDPNTGEWRGENFGPDGDWDYEEDFHNEPGFFAQLFEAIFYAVIMGGIAYFIATIVPQRLALVRDAVEGETAASTGVGFLSMIAIPSGLAIIAALTAVLIFICIGIVGIPILIAGILTYFGAMALGLTSIGAWAGERLVDYLPTRKWRSPELTAVGTAAITLGLGLLALIPCFPNGLVTFATVMIGVGGVVLTKFGSQPYPNIIVDPQKVEDNPIDF